MGVKQRVKALSNRLYITQWNVPNNQKLVQKNNNVSSTKESMVLQCSLLGLLVNLHSSLRIYATSNLVQIGIYDDVNDAHIIIFFQSITNSIKEFETYIICGVNRFTIKVILLKIFVRLLQRNSLF